MLAIYDEEDNIVAVFDNAKEVAKWFNTSVQCIYKYLERNKIKDNQMKLDKETGKWYKIIKIKEDVNGNS